MGGFGLWDKMTILSVVRNPNLGAYSMNDNFLKSLDILWAQANLHCRFHRLCEPANGLSLDQVRWLASLMLDLFETEAERLRAYNDASKTKSPGSYNDPGNSEAGAHVRARRRPRS